jgi:hypothetical protein
MAMTLNVERIVGSDHITELERYISIMEYRIQELKNILSINIGSPLDMLILNNEKYKELIRDNREFITLKSFNDKYDHMVEALTDTVGILSMVKSKGIDYDSIEPAKQPHDGGNFTPPKFPWGWVVARAFVITGLVLICLLIF